jgi:hypothetical protein
LFEINVIEDVNGTKLIRSLSGDGKIDFFRGNTTGSLGRKKKLASPSGARYVERPGFWLAVHISPVFICCCTFGLEMVDSCSKNRRSAPHYSFSTDNPRNIVVDLDPAACYEPPVIFVCFESGRLRQDGRQGAAPTSPEFPRTTATVRLYCFYSRVAAI